MKYLINTFIQWASVLVQIVFISTIIFSKRKKVRFWLKKYAMHIAFMVSVSATLGSLFYSEIMAYTPCKLCWFQRIFMYPLTIIAGFSLRQVFSLIVKRVMLTLASIGILFSAYHYISQITDTTTFCGIGAQDCADKIVFAFGYLSIPLMAFTAFAIILFAIYFYSPKKSRKK